jgi:fimbrial chaperone protein
MIRRLAAMVLLLGATTSARAAGMQITPVVVELSAAAPRATVELKNLAGAPARLELTASAWEQTADGQTRLAPAPEIVVFPPLLEIAPGEVRKIRVSTTAAFGAKEQAYRLSIRELPPAQKPGDANALTFLTRFSLPVFLMPARPALRAEIAGTAVHDGKLALTIRNTGSTRLSPGTVKIEGLDAQGKHVLSASADVWYVLAGGERVLDVPVPAEGCGRVRALVAEVPVGDASSVRARVETPEGACAP